MAVWLQIHCLHALMCCLFCSLYLGTQNPVIINVALVPRNKEDCNTSRTYLFHFRRFNRPFNLTDHDAYNKIGLNIWSHCTIYYFL